MTLNCDQIFLSPHSLALPGLLLQEETESEHLRKINSCFKTKLSRSLPNLKIYCNVPCAAESKMFVTDTFLL